MSIDSGPWLSPDEERAWRALQFMQLRLDGELSRQLARDGDLSYAEYVVLVALIDAPDGRLRLGELGRRLSWEQSRLSHQVARMQRRGLVEKEACASDRRGAVVVVTAAGRGEIARAAPGHAATVRRIFVDRLTPEQLAALGAAAEQVLAQWENGTGEV